MGGPGGGAPGAPGATGDRAGGQLSRGTSGEITSWVTSHFTKIEVGGRTVYDLSRPPA
jgi:hypothetical protein